MDFGSTNDNSNILVQNSDEEAQQEGPAPGNAPVAASAALPPLTLDLPPLTLRDAATRAMSPQASAGRTSRPSDTPLFDTILRVALLQEDRHDATSSVEEGEEGQIPSAADSAWTKELSEKMTDKEVSPVLTRLLAADAVLYSESSEGKSGGGEGGGGGSCQVSLKGASSSAIDAGGEGGGGGGSVASFFRLIRRGTSGSGGGRSGGSGGVGGGGSSGGFSSEPPSLTVSICDVSDVGKLLPAAPRRVCQYAFQQNDIVWICKVGYMR